LLHNQKFTWSISTQEAFTELKLQISQVPTLYLPDFSLPFVVETDASAVVVGAVLSQKGHPLSFFRKKMCPRLQASSVYVREMYAITKAVQKWRQSLLGQHFKIITDQKSLNTLQSQTIQTPEQKRWISKLQGYDFQTLYRPGKKNVVADALSRQDTYPPSMLLALSSPIPLLFEELQQFYSIIEGTTLVDACTKDTQRPSLFSVHHDLLFFCHQVFLPDTNNFRNCILQELHESPTTGHSGIKPTLARIAAAFYWLGWTRDVKNYIQQCTTCQRNKYLPTKPHGLLQPPSLPNQVWEDLSMDFITHLPASVGHSVIWVICDRLTKYAHFLALPKQFNA